MGDAKGSTGQIMTTIKITITAQDETGTIFTSTVIVPRSELIPPGMETPGLKAIAEALLKA